MGTDRAGRPAPSETRPALPPRTDAPIHPGSAGRSRARAARSPPPRTKCRRLERRARRSRRRSAGSDRGASMPPSCRDRGLARGASRRPGQPRRPAAGQSPPHGRQRGAEGHTPTAPDAASVEPILQAEARRPASGASAPARPRARLPASSVLPERTPARRCPDGTGRGRPAQSRPRTPAVGPVARRSPGPARPSRRRKGRSTPCSPGGSTRGSGGAPVSARCSVAPPPVVVEHPTPDEGPSAERQGPPVRERAIPSKAS